MQGSLDASLTSAPVPTSRIFLFGMSSVPKRLCTRLRTDCLAGYFGQVWTFLVSDATFKTSATGSGSTVSAPEVHVDKVKIIAVRQMSPARFLQRVSQSPQVLALISTALLEDSADCPYYQGIMVQARYTVSAMPRFNGSWWLCRWMRSWSCFDLQPNCGSC